LASDLQARFPEAKIDWVVEEAYAPIPALHSGVSRVIPIALRRWRKQLFQRTAWQEFNHFLTQLKQEHYDFVLDTQGLYKSAFIARAAHRGLIVGGDSSSIKEPGAARFYDRQLPIAWSRHVIDRCRAVGAGALNYTLDTPPRFGISSAPLVADWLPDDAPDRYAVLMHAASRDPKLWLESHWVELGRFLATQGLFAVLPWGNPTEHARSQRIAAQLSGAVVPPLMPLDVAAKALAGARLVVGLDTGFTHFAAALGRPTIGVFCDSDGVQAAAFGERFCESFGRKGQPPSLEIILDAAQRALATAVA
jgi:heptosyltransferase-1